MYQKKMRKKEEEEEEKIVNIQRPPSVLHGWIRIRVAQGN